MGIVGKGPEFIMILTFYFSFLVLNYVKGNFNDSFKFHCPTGEYVSHIEDGVHWNFTCTKGADRACQWLPFQVSSILEEERSSQCDGGAVTAFQYKKDSNRWRMQCCKIAIQHDDSITCGIWENMVLTRREDTSRFIGALKEKFGVWKVKKCSLQEVLTVTDSIAKTTIDSTKFEDSEESEGSGEPFFEESENLKKSKQSKESNESDQELIKNSTVKRNQRHFSENIAGDSKDDSPIQTYRNAKQFLGTSDFETQIIIVASLFGVALLAINIITIVCCKCKCCRCCYNFFCYPSKDDYEDDEESYDE